MEPLVLIVEDEPDLLAPLVFALRKEGFRTLTAMTGQEGLEAARAHRPDLLLLDWMLPDTSGTEVVRSLRADPGTRALPIIMVTARASEIDRVVGFELGVDDYVCKPFSTRELALRMRAVLRRVEDEATPAGRRLRLEEGVATLDGRDLHLTPSEARVLAHLMRGAAKVLSREELIDSAWEQDATPATSRAVDSVIKRLRKKLGDEEACIQAIRGRGYRFTWPA